MIRRTKKDILRIYNVKYIASTSLNYFYIKNDNLINSHIIFHQKF